MGSVVQICLHTRLREEIGQGISHWPGFPDFLN